jgi:hypothetical protein
VIGGQHPFRYDDIAACIIKNGVLLIAKGCDGMVSECHRIDGVARPSTGNRNGHWLVWLTGKMCRKIVRLISKCRKGARLLNILLVRSCKSTRILKKSKSFRDPDAFHDTAVQILVCFNKLFEFPSNRLYCFFKVSGWFHLC